MLFDMCGQRIECAFHSAAIAFVRRIDAESREIRTAERIRREQAMQIAALHAAVRRGCAFRRSTDVREGTATVVAFRASDMDFVRLDWLLRLDMPSLDSREVLFRCHDRADIEKPKSWRRAGRSLDAIGVGDV